MDPGVGWSLDAALDSFLREQRGYTSIHQMDSHLREAEAARAQPYPLPLIREAIRNNAPPKSLPYLDNIFCGMVFETTPNAFAYSNSTVANVAVIHNSCNTLLILFAHVMTEFDPEFKQFFRDFGEDHLTALFETHKNSLFGLLQAEVDEFYDSTNFSPQLEAAVASMCAFVSGQEFRWADLKSVIERIDRSERTQFVESIVLGGLTFIIAHECAHHLLGHTHFSGSEDSPGRIALEEMQTRIGYRLPIGQNRSQTAEFEADALAYLLASGLAGSDQSPDVTTIAAAGASGSAIGALAAIASYGGDRLPLLASKGATHPSLDDRLSLVFRLAIDGALGPNAGENHPEFALQLFAASLFINRCTSFPRLRPRSQD